ncbi:putative transcription elongation factor [Rhypophila decipiens]|uniref:Transcription elongation factor n=1 Tax=Rhypophila decipiens TaxID=261697 RepID=A0AAN6YJF0_9PEZI|nr:putative transcription elongation factor [Rhypophila decipiens]
MDDRELSLRIRALAKAVAGSEPASNIVTMLEQLKKDAAPTEEQLRSTKAGVTVGKLRSNPDKEIAKAAAEVVSKWRNHVTAASKAKQRSLAGKSPTPNQTASPAPAPSSYSKPFEGNPEKRHFKTDNVDIHRTGNQGRDNSIGLLYNGLAFRSTSSIEEVLNKAVEVEASAYKTYNGETQDYKMKLRSLFTSLKRKDNEALRKRVLSGEIAPAQFVVMTDKELASEEQRAIDAKLRAENMKNAQVPKAERSVSSALKCGKCGQKKVSYSQAQTRSADEPMTTFCECLVCGNRWKFS